MNSSAIKKSHQISANEISTTYLYDKNVFNFPSNKKKFLIGVLMIAQTLALFLYHEVNARNLHMEHMFCITILCAKQSDRMTCGSPLAISTYRITFFSINNRSLQTLINFEQLLLYTCCCCCCFFLKINSNVKIFKKFMDLTLISLTTNLYRYSYTFYSSIRLV